MVQIDKKPFYDISEVAARLHLSETRVAQLTQTLLKKETHYTYLRRTILYNEQGIKALDGRNKKWGRPKKNGK